VRVNAGRFVERDEVNMRNTIAGPEKSRKPGQVMEKGAKQGSLRG
jgi:hypothetical protein